MRVPSLSDGQGYLCPGNSNLLVGFAAGFYTITSLTVFSLGASLAGYDLLLSFFTGSLFFLLSFCSFYSFCSFCLSAFISGSFFSFFFSTFASYFGFSVLDFDSCLLTFDFSYFCVLVCFVLSAFFGSVFFSSGAAAFLTGNSGFF